MNPLAPSTHVFEFLGGWLCLDFTNTIGYIADPEATDGLRTFADLIAWGEQAGVASSAEAQAWLEASSQNPAEAKILLAKALALRTTLYRLFTADGHTSDPSTVAALDAVLREASIHRAFTRIPTGFVWLWHTADTPERVLWQVAWSASELLLSDQRERVRQCAGDDCTYLFVDTSRNHSRRWCDMKVCGNQAKAHRHYRRLRTAAS